MDLLAFFARYAGDGRRNQPYHPAMMVKVLVYRYASGVFSSRKIARRLHEDVAFRVLAAGNQPAHRTRCEFRRLHLAELTGLFVPLVRLARELGLVRLGTIALDGTQVRASASQHQAMSYGRMREQEARLEQEIRALLERAQVEDAEEDRQFGAESSAEDLPAELARRQQRLEQIRAAKGRLEAGQRAADRERGRHEEDGGKSSKNGGRGPRFKRPFGVPKDGAQDNFTDPESRIMNTTEGFQQCYNGFAAVEEASQLIVANSVTNHATDNDQLLPLVASAEANADSPVTRVIADAGFRAEAAFVSLEEQGIEPLVSLGREGKAPPPIDAVRHPATDRLCERLATVEGKARYRRRQVIPEPVFGWIKHVLGFRRFSLRGLGKVNGEWNLVTLAVNVKRMHALCS